MNLQLLPHSHLLSAAFWSCLYIKTPHKLTPTEDAPISLHPTYFPIQASARSTDRIVTHTGFVKTHRPNIYLLLSLTQNYTYPAHCKYTYLKRNQTHASICSTNTASVMRYIFWNLKTRLNNTPSFVVVFIVQIHNFIFWISTIFESWFT